MPQRSFHPPSLTTFQAEKLLSPQGDYDAYRAYLEGASQGAGLNIRAPYVLLQTFFLQRLSTAAELPTVTEQNNLINIVKIEKIGKVMEALRHARQAVHKIDESSSLQRFLLGGMRSALSEMELLASTAVRDEKLGRELFSPRSMKGSAPTPKRKKEKIKRKNTIG